jgi:hypothetical protein
MFGPPFSSRGPSFGFPMTPPSHSWPVSFGFAGLSTAPNVRRESSATA